MRILFITSTRIGDAVLSSGLLAALIERYPEARFTIACGPLPSVLFRDMPGVERIIPMTKGPLGRHWVSLWLKTIGKSWSHVIDLRSSAMAWLLLTRHRHVQRKTTLHRVEAAAKVLGLAPAPAPRIFASDAVKKEASILLGPGPILALGPTANWVGKQWPAERYGELVRRLGGQQGPFRDARILVLGAEHERPAAMPLLESIGKERLIDLIGKVDLLSAYACLEKASLYVGNDSGLMHLAAAAGVPTLGLFGPSNEALYGPWGAKAKAVRGALSFEEMTKGDFDFAAPTCHMLDLSVEHVEEAALSLMKDCINLNIQ